MPDQLLGKGPLPALLALIVCQGLGLGQSGSLVLVASQSACGFLKQHLP